MNTHKISSVQNQIENVLRDQILSGALQPGNKITAQELASQLGLSRTPVQTALKALIKEGLIENRTVNANYVADAPSDSNKMLLNNIKKQVEDFCLQQFRLNYSADDIKELEAYHLEAKRALSTHDSLSFINGCMAFHKHYIDAAGQDMTNIWYPIALRLRLGDGKPVYNEKELLSIEDILHDLKGQAESQAS
ncbi:GntR family transcriptional regulator [Catenovulum sediminis]|uniref:GntR family transcriptional regulator n=1 Tax=Catenovulum sediminis TaxID=1740262 RepID=A0ABV1RG47_9ALTE|nr:GntR family transcriptional regulator [Catenovulum sediminis]